MKFRVSAVLPCPAKTYFVERDSAAFRSLVAKVCNLESLEVGKSWMSGEAEVYEFITKPNVSHYVPTSFMNFLPGGDLHYTDVIEYNPKDLAQSPYRMKVHSIPPIFASKTRIDSVLTIEEETPTTCRQTLEGTIQIKILGLGPIAEKIVVDNLKKVYQGVPRIVERWVQFRNEVLKSPQGKDVLISGRPKNSGIDWINDQIRTLLKADDSEMKTSCAPKNEFSFEPSAQPSLEELMADQTLQPLSVDDDTFFDAREDASWSDLSGVLSDNPDTQARLREDREEATSWLRTVRKSGRKLQPVEVDIAPPTMDPGTPGKVQSSRFSQHYNEELDEWKQFWTEHEVPVSKDVPDIKARLGNLFHIGAAAGIFKPHKHVHRLRHKQRLKHNSNGAADGELDRADVGSAVTSEASGSTDGHSTEDKRKGHGGSGSFGDNIKRIFVKKKSGSSQEG